MEARNLERSFEYLNRGASMFQNQINIAEQVYNFKEVD